MTKKDMTREVLNRLNERFQHQAAAISELLPSGNLLSYSSTLIRSAKRMELLLKKVLEKDSANRFLQILDSLEEEMDEIIFALDQLDIANRGMKIQRITDFVKEGYELLSIYSIICDQMIEKKLKHKELE